MAKQDTKTTNYTTFYLIMLILTTINFVFHLPAFFDIPQLFSTFSELPVFAVISLIDLVFVVVGIIGLVYLYQKQIRGYWIILGYVVTQLILTPLLLLNLGQVLDYYSLLNPPEKLSTDELAAYTSIMYAVFYVVMAVGMIYYTAIGTLWYFAWKNQLAADKPTLKHKK